MAPPDTENGVEVPPHHNTDETEDGGDWERALACDGHEKGMPAVDQDHKACDEHTQGGHSCHVQAYVGPNRDLECPGASFVAVLVASGTDCNPWMTTTVTYRRQSEGCLLEHLPLYRSRRNFLLKMFGSSSAWSPC